VRARHLTPLLALFALGCAHRLRYDVGLPDTPRAPFGTPYVVAVTEIADRRVPEKGEIRDFPEGRYRFVPDASIPVAGVDATDMLVRHLRFSGLFRRVVRAGADERAHLLLAGELRRLRVYALEAPLLQRDKAIADGVTGVAANPDIPARVDVQLRLSLWRVDKKWPVWVKALPISFSRLYRGNLRIVTDLGFRDAMNEVVREIARPLAPHRSGEPHPLEGT
jgi:hypothetical protein